MSAYETTLEIAQFSGIYQDGDGVNMNLKYATDAENCDTRGGSLKPMRKGAPQNGTLSAPIGTLMHLYRRHNVIDGERDVLIAACGTKLYYKLIANTAWTEIVGFSISNDRMDYVTYEVTRPGDAEPTDILLMTNADDGMTCVYGDDFTASHVTTPYNFGILCRHAERIWGSGIPNEPDRLCYSAPYNPFDWTQNNAIPEDGSGEADQPSWDGDSFIALRAFGSYLLAFKRRKVWRILGTDPGDYIMREQFGGGALVENTICVGDGYALMLGYDSLMLYDGSATSEFQSRAIQTMLGRVNREAIHGACAALKGGVYYLAVPLDGAIKNNAIIEYDMTDKTFNVRTGVYPTSFLQIENKLYYTSSEDPYRVYLLNGGEVLPLEWISAYQDLHAKNTVKSNFYVYCTPEATAPCDITVSIETEKKQKSKTFVARPDGKTHRLQIGNSGRRFRIKITANAGIDFTMLGGVQIGCELDAD